MIDRRSFLGAMLAAATAPAIVRASSLMILPRKVDWTSFVRETTFYDIGQDQFVRRLDILAGSKQFHVDSLAVRQDYFAGREGGTRQMMLDVLSSHVKMCGYYPSDLRMLQAVPNVHSTIGTPLMKRPSFFTNLPVGSGYA